MENINWNILFLYTMLVFAFLLELHYLLKNVKAKSWNKAKGMVLSSETGLGGPSEGTLKAKVRYTYWVNGEELESNKIAYATLDTWFAIFKRLYIKVGETEVYYNPEKPTESVLVPGVRLFHVLDMCIILACGLYFQTIVS
ncbi:DUF3592 domain-containing protein [Vibrio hangzhouensis]|uniref:DUF3592 domain-containing protein n=1 Tax=Vibrio hangzhouensis TaxID=462991 RepID=A0A1H5X3L8_9VIBR|nr:DUF3592 domain-containing protein [Vibrio hangzhouensis]SEG06341.1 Protein of unknown function [Vibrio hangzhouensis]